MYIWGKKYNLYQCIIRVREVTEMDCRINIAMPDKSDFEKLLSDYIKARDALHNFLTPDFCEPVRKEKLPAATDSFNRD